MEINIGERIAYFKDIDWVKRVIESKLTVQFVENVKQIAKKGTVM